MLRGIIRFFHFFIYLNYKILGFLWEMNAGFETWIEAFWLSRLSNVQLQELIGTYYKNNKKYCTKENTTKGLFEWEKQLVESLPVKSGSVVLVGAGGGRECYSLIRRGFNVCAYEPDKNMVDFARSFFAEQQMDIEFKRSQANVIPEDKCDIFWFGWGVYTHIIGQNQRVELLREAAKNISTDGCIVLSYWRELRKKDRVEKLDRLTKSLGKRKVETGESFIRGLWGMRFTPEKVRVEAELAGLKVIFINDKDYGSAILVK